MRNHFRTRTLSKIVTENAPLPASALVESESQARAEPRKKIHLASPIIDAEMKAAALAALENEMMVMGESVFEFEEEFAKYCGTKYAVSTASGTAALSITFQALNIGHGNEVITTPFSFIITTNNEELADAAQSIRDCGRDKNSKYYHGRIGFTSRLNTVNAAIGRIQLKRLEAWNEARRRISGQYGKELENVRDIILPPLEASFEKAVYHLFVIRTKFRDQVKKRLADNGIETGIHYPRPIHLQAPYREKYGYAEGAFPLSESLSNEVLSLPMYPTLAEKEVVRVCDALKKSLVA